MRLWRLVAILTAILVSGAGHSSDSPKYVADLKSPDFQKRSHAMNEMARRLKAGQCDRVLISALLEAGGEKDHVLRMSLSNLYELVPPSATSLLIEFLESESNTVRGGAATVLGVLGPQSREALPRLLDLLRDNHDAVRSSASFAIGKIDSQAGTTLPRVVAMLKSQSEQDKLVAAHTLDGLGPVAGKNTPDVIAALDDADENLRYWLVVVLGNQPASTPQLLDAFLRLLRADPSAFVRERIARELWEMGMDAEPEVVRVVPDLEQALSDQAAGVRAQSAKALQAIREHTQAR
jgi:HEAT repeat protein